MDVVLYRCGLLVRVAKRLRIRTFLAIMARGTASLFQHYDMRSKSVVMGELYLDHFPQLKEVSLKEPYKADFYQGVVQDFSFC